MANILVVDDDSDIRELLSISLGLEGHTVAEAPDGRTALEMVSESDYELVVLDVNMPHMTGLEMVAQMRSTPSSPQPLVLMLSAMASPDDVAAGLAAGADEYTTKPFHVSHLSTHVDRMLNDRCA